MMYKLKQFFCFHKFKLEKTLYFSPPKYNVPPTIPIKDIKENYAMFICYGETQVFYKCEKCGKQNIEKYFGQVKYNKFIEAILN